MDKEDNNELVAADQPEASRGKFEIAVQEDGVYLTVNPNTNGSPVGEPEVLAELQKKNITDFNRPLLAKTVQEATGTPVKLGEIPVPPQAPDIQVLVERDRMEAFVLISVSPNSRPPMPEEVYAKIEAAGVRFGVDNANVEKVCKYPGTRTTVAIGQKPKDGHDARITYLFNTDPKGKPTELANGSVDYKNINLFTAVEAGAVLAEKVPSVPGEPGIDVLGNAIPPKPAKDIPLPLGKNVTASDNKITASISGQVILANNKISVVPLIEIKGDVDFSSGNIEFNGNVTVRGSVQAGFFVKADGDVEVQGSICGGIVEGKNVTVRMGIQGMLRGYVKAKQNVTAKFIENSQVSADGDIYVSDVILHSHVSARHKIIVEGRRGLIAGGQISAGEEIRAKVVGTQLAVTTELEVGINPSLREEYANLRKEIRKVEVTLDQAQKSLALLRSLDQNTLTQDKREMLLKLTKAQFQLAGQSETIHNRIQQIEQELEEMRLGRIRVSESVYPGVKIVVGSHVKPVREPVRYVSFYAEDGELKTGSFN